MKFDTYELMWWEKMLRINGWTQLDAYDWRPPKDYVGPYKDRDRLDVLIAIADLQDKGYESPRNDEE
jgi:hypothetical protein